jgi:SAM-dependent methyltransferase
MAVDHAPSRNWFAQGGQAYARFRPEYPAELAQYLASISPGRALAVDVGCGNGQLTTLLAAHFDRVAGLDPSADLVTAAQAAHWFDLPRFYDEVRRIGAPNAVVALVSYGILRLDENLDARFAQFYWQEIGPYWPAERKLVDTGYVDLPFPFEERVAPTLEIRKTWTREELLGYISTWSAVRSVREAGREDILHCFAEDLAILWGDPSRRREVRWPINMRLGKR